MIKIVPAILEKDGAAAARLCARLCVAAGAVHIDFADGTMTENTTCDLYDLVDGCSDCAPDVHLMTLYPEKYFDACATLNAARVYVHVGEVDSPTRVLDAAAAYTFAIGMAVSPQTRVEDIMPYMERVQAVQVMTVVPGRQGGVFLPDMLEKVRAVRATRPDITIVVDGGVSITTLSLVAESGATVAAVGSAITASPDPVVAYKELSAATHSP